MYNELLQIHAKMLPNKMTKQSECERARVEIEEFIGYIQT